MIWAKFIYQLTPALIELGRLLFARCKGDIEAAKTELKKIPDYWSNINAQESEIDRQLKLLKKK